MPEDIMFQRELILHVVFYFMIQMKNYISSLTPTKSFRTQLGCHITILSPKKPYHIPAPLVSMCESTTNFSFLKQGKKLRETGS